MTKTEFDNCIRNAFCAHSHIDPFGYHLDNPDRYYANYFSNEFFDAFCAEMKVHYPAAYKKYTAGKGGELQSQKRNGVYTPPKMASIGSSSRFCYLTLREGAQALGGEDVIDFEHSCKIEGVCGIPPQLDAHIPNGNIYVEAKCHEIFDEHSISLSGQYFDWLCRKENGFCLPESIKSGNRITIPLCTFGIHGNHTMFDIKQLLCHLMGIASQSKQDAYLVYLFFKPQAVMAKEREQIEKIFTNLKDEIHSIFTSDPIVRFCAANRITLRAVAQHSARMQALTADNTITLY